MVLVSYLAETRQRTGSKTIFMVGVVVGVELVRISNIDNLMV